MNAQNENQFVYKDTNIMRLAGLLFLVISPVFFILTKNSTLMMVGTISVDKLLAWVFVAIGLMMVLFSPNLTVVADKPTRMLRLQYGMIFRRTKSIPFDDIADIQSQAGVNNRNASMRGYRLVAVMKDGTVAPFRSYFTRHDNKKQAAVDLRLAVTGSRHSEVAKVDSAGASLTI